MSEDFQEHIFDNYSLERGRNSNRVKGPGLGMPICAQLIKLMGGTISVESQLYEGSRFTVVFRSEICHSPETVEEDAQTDEVLFSEPLHVLVAEDEEISAMILTTILQDNGYQVNCVSNGREAVNMFVSSPVGKYDAILLDMVMPVMDGCQAAAAIRALKRPDARTVPIFACTANAFDEHREETLRCGMNDFITKPLNVNELLDKLTEAFKRSSKRIAADNRKEE